MIDTARYHIINAKSGHLAILPDGNEASDLVSGLNENLSSEKWNVTLLNNTKYSIKNHEFGYYPHCGTRASKGDVIQGKPNMQQLVIKDTRYKGQYTISPSDRTELFWGLEDEELGTPITLRDSSTDQRNHWKFVKASA